MPKERWFDEAVVEAPKEDRGRLRKESLGPLPEVWNVRELEKNAFERESYEKSLAALNVLLGEIGLPPASVSSGRIHIVSDEEYDRSIGSESRGSAAYGHGYVRRQESKNDSCMT